jgi:hypothetical protein
MKYLKSKTDSVEESILQMWEKAAKRTEDNTNDKSDDGEGLDKVQPKAVKKKFKNRKDKDIDNDGDVDASDKYLHKRRKTVSKAIAKEARQLELKRQLKDPKKEMMVALKGKVKVIDKSEWPEYKKKGYNQAEEVEENLDVGTPENTKSKLEATPGQSVDAWEEQLETIQKKNSSMRERLAQIWGMDEGNSPFEKDKKKEEKIPKKTMTGEPVTKVEVDPKINDQ